MEPIEQWLSYLGGQEDAYLWPNTPVGNLQAEIYCRVGASDLNLDDDRCRTRNIRDTLLSMISNRLLDHNPTIIDLCCGDGAVIGIISATYKCRCYGIDLASYGSHKIYEQYGVRFFNTSIQEVVSSVPPESIDVCIMLNTFRGWEKSGIENWKELRDKTLAWMKEFCRYVILTIEHKDRDWLINKGFFIWNIGPGEDDSDLICGFPGAKL